jgi:hypothetical protein
MIDDLRLMIFSKCGGGTNRKSSIINPPADFVVLAANELRRHHL